MARMIDNRVLVDRGGLIGAHIRAGHFCVPNCVNICPKISRRKPSVGKSRTTMLLVTTPQGSEVDEGIQYAGVQDSRHWQQTDFANR